ncbi:Thiol-disulfide oxidoreductase ResA [Candidatus Hepatincola sp. Av]
MKKVFLTIIILNCLFLVSKTWAAFPIPTKPNTKLLLVEFWASWCPYCRQSLPWLEDMQNTFASQGLEVISVNFSDKKSNAKALITKNKYTFPVNYDENLALANMFQVVAVPTIILINQHGEVLVYQRGISPESEKVLKEKIATLLKPIK